MTALAKYETARAALVLPEFNCVGERQESAVSFLRTRLVTTSEYRLAHQKTGSIYFIKNVAADAIKVGHSGAPRRRLSQLQVGNSARLELIGVVAAEIAIEKIVHEQLTGGQIGGEWFWDRGVTTQWLMDMTQGEPLYRQVWTLVPGREVFHSWDETTQTHTKHILNRELERWEPPIPL